MRKDFDRAYLTAHGNVAVITLNHPEALNAASMKMLNGLSQAFAQIEKSGDFRAVVLTGEGRGFCSGANLTEIPEERAATAGVGSALETAYHPFLRRLRDSRYPIVTAVNGVAAGVGMSIALMGDIVLAARSAYFLQAFARIGLVPDGGSTWLLPRLIGLARARELSLLAEKLPAEKALEWGLINQVHDDAALMDAALKLAQRLAEGPRSLGMIRKLYWESPHNSYEVQIDRERETQMKAGQTKDFIEGVTAFSQKRPAKFQGN
ncbi:MAG: enoyl-CoA hydratase/isomerase [Rhizomicrobium sp.]|jgi:2-(1,2-epoxy-1,2-dihydrophenyl)acetyl-CoA isomerase